MKKIFLAMILLLDLLGCRRRTTEASSTEHIRKQNLRSQVLVRDGQSPNEFEVHIQAGPEVFYRVDGFSEIHSTSRSPVVPSLFIVPGTVMRLHFGELIHGEWQERSIQLVQIPKDCVLSGRLDWQGKDVSLESCHRVFFQSDLNLWLDDHRYLVSGAKMIFEEGSEISSFPQGARMGQHGRQGPQLTLQADEVRGALNIQLNGENGSPGRDARHLYDPAGLMEKIRSQAGVAGENGFNSGKGGQLTLRARVVSCTRTPRLEVYGGAPGTAGRALPIGAYEGQLSPDMGLKVHWPVIHEPVAASGAAGESGELQIEVAHWMCR